MSKVIKQHNDASYSKEQNNVEKYLMKIIQRYFLVEQEYTEGQKEAIIVEAIRRIKIYLAEHRAGVFALNHKTGIVHLDITDFNGEPEFEKKNSFNKDFGESEDTICEGNDQRLSDNRTPIKHEHYIEDVDGLDAALQKRYSINIVGHEHNEKDALDKIIYTGSSPEVDLVLFEQFLDMVNMFITQLKLLQINTNDIHNKFKEFLGTMQVRFESMNEIYAEFMKEQSWISDAKAYADVRKEDYIEMCRQRLRAYMTDEEFKELIRGLKFVDNIKGYLDFNPNEDIKISVTDEHVTDLFNINAVVYNDHTLLPVQGIKVQLENGQSLVTSADGKFAFNNLSKGEHLLTFTKSNFHTTWMHIFLNDSTANIEDVYIVPIMVTLTVTVKGTSDEPLLAGAIVKLSELNLTAVTGADGKCEFKVYQDRTYTLSTTYEDYNASGNVTVTSHETDFATTITLTPITHTLTVQAVDIADNRNIERTDTTVRITGVGITANETKNTDANGTAQFTVRQNRDYKISISNKRYMPYEDTEIHIGNTDMTQVLKLTRKTVSLKVYVKGTTSEPVLAGSTIIMNGVSYTTDSNGMYELTVPNYESYNITAKYTDYNDKEVTAEVGDDDKSITITLEPIMHTLTVNVKEMYTNANLSGATAKLTFGTTPVQSSTDSNGNVTFELRQNRPYKLKVTKNNYIASEEYDISLSRDDTFNVVLKHEPVTVTFVVKSEESAPNYMVSGAVITISGDSSTYTTNSNGTITASVDPYKSYTFTATLPTSDIYPSDEYVTRTLTESKTLSTAENINQTFTFTAARYNINVTVKDENGDVISGQPVKINDDTVNTNSNGVATVNVRGKRLYLVSVSRTGYNPVINEMINLGTSDFDKTINLTLVETKLTITVKDSVNNNALMPEVTIKVKNITDDTEEETVGSTNANGEIIVTLKGNKSYKITASKSGYADSTLNYTTGTTMANDSKLITMQIANHVKGKVLNTRTNGGISGVTVKITGTSYTAQTNDSGEYDIVGVAAGTYSFEFTKEGFESDTTSLTNIVVQAGQDKTNADVLLTPMLASNQYEFHLSWNESSDIDLHANGSFTDTNYNSSQYYHIGYDSNGSMHTFSYGGSSIFWDTDTHGNDGTNENITLTLVKGSAYFYVVNWSGRATSFNWTLKGGDGTNKSGSYTFYGNGTSNNKETKGICTVYNYANGSSGVIVH